MSARIPLLRRIAFRLIDHAGKILPPSHAIWAQAMKHELHHIEGDLEGLRWAAGCVIASYIERGGPKMDHSFGSMVKKPSAYLPLAMSLTALSLVGGTYIYSVAMGHGGLVRERDEGAIAHLWQLLMAGQLPVLGFFAIKWLPRAPRQTLYVLALQAGAVIAAMAPVYLLNL